MAEKICWEFKGLDGKPFMQIRSSSNELSYELWEWTEIRKKSGESVFEWKSLETYPWSIASAVSKVRERMVRKQGGQTNDVRRMERFLAAMEENIERTLRVR